MPRILDSAAFEQLGRGDRPARDHHAFGRPDQLFGFVGPDDRDHPSRLPWFRTPKGTLVPLDPLDFGIGQDACAVVLADIGQIALPHRPLARIWAAGVAIPRAGAGIGSVGRAEILVVPARVCAGDPRIAAALRESFPAIEQVLPVADSVPGRDL